MPSGTSYTPGFSTCPDTAMNFSPAKPCLPCAFHHRPAVHRMPGDVRERLDVVDERRLAVQAVRAGERRLVPRLAALSSRASSRAVSSPRMYPPGETKTSMSNCAGAEDGLAEHPGRRPAAIAASKPLRSASYSCRR